MAVYPVMKVEPFTNRVQDHTPCAVLLNSDALDGTAMNTIADQINVQETVFVTQADKADFGLRCFNRIGEQRLRSRSIVAAVFALADAGLLSFGADQTELSLETNGRLTRVKLVFKDGILEQVVITKITPEFLTIHQPGIVSIFGISLEDVYPYAFVQTVGTESQHLLIAVKYLETVRQIQLNATAYADLIKTVDIAGVHIFCLRGATQDGQIYARHFGTEPDALEEPLSVSGTCNMAAYLWRYGMLGQSKFIAEHGPWLKQPERAVVEIVGTREQIQEIRVGGTAVVLARDRFIVPIR